MLNFEASRIAAGDNEKMRLDGASFFNIKASRITAGDTERMQNELKTNTTGTVATVHVLEGATVETGAALITIVALES
jgi:acetyl/propionyl-CoA carboxylase alpha subunit